MKLEFYDVFSIGEPELLAFVPRLAQLLISPVSDAYEKFRIQVDTETGV
jgi:hypothetical protein